MTGKKLISLDKFINQALYDKKEGYYMKKLPFGKQGDFITSPGISKIFSEIITIWIILYWESLGKPKRFNIVELGSGDGELMVNMIKTSKNFQDFFNKTSFYILEKSNYLKKIQQKKLKGSKIKWIKDPKNIKNCNTIFFGNEFLDAFAIKQFFKLNNVWYERYVNENKNKNFFEDIKTNIKKYEKLIGFKFYENQKIVEISIDQIKFVKKLSKFVNKNGGGILFIDYGYNKFEMIDTLQAISKHSKKEVLINKGNQDITYLINFNFLKKYFKYCGLEVNGITTQSNFLKNMGIFERAEIVSKNKSFLSKSDIYFRIRRLTDKKQMGELFKVIFASKKTNKFSKGFNV